MAIYVPSYSSGNCVVLQNYYTIRKYATTPRNNSTISYVDYYFTSDYYSNSGNQTFGSTTTLPVCRTDITTNWLYRYDIDKIFIVASIIFAIIVFFVLKPIIRIMGRWLKYD